MAQAMPPPGAPSPQQMQQMQQAMAAEAQRRGMTLEQFQAEQRAKLEAAARAQGMTPQQMAQMQAQMQSALMQEAARRGMTVEQFQAEQRARVEAEAKAQGLTPEQFVAKLRAEAVANHQRQAQMQQQQQAQQAQQGQVQEGAPPQQHQHQHQHAPQGQQQVAIPANAPVNPQALALMGWLRTQGVKARTCILNGERKEMFKVKRALRAIESPAYAKAAANPKNNLPPVTAQNPPANVFMLLPLSRLALQVTQIDPHEGHGHAKPKKRVKGLWTVKVEQNSAIHPDVHYAFLVDVPQTKNKIYAGLAVAGILAVVLFPLWPATLRLGVWYLSMGMLGLLGLFFAMAFVRLILFCVTVFAVPPGLWLYPNLFEDVGFFDSFRPAWGWQEDQKAVKKAKRDQRKAKADARASKAAAVPGGASGTDSPAPVPAAGVAQAAVAGDAASSSAAPQDGEATRRSLAPRVEEVDDSD